MFNWLISLFSCEKPIIDLVSLTIQESTGSCNLHKNYLGNVPPVNNCNICWEYYSKKVQWSK